MLTETLSGQRRVNELFRRVQGRLVRREVVLTVAEQDDGPKRVRDARKQLQPEGILILGHQGSHPQLANRLNIQTPPKGSWIAIRVVPVDAADHTGVEIDGSWWRTATKRDQHTPGPSSYQ